MSRTWFLAAIAVAAVLMQIFPTYGGPIKWVAITLGVLYLLARVIGTYPGQFRQKRALAARHAADEREFRDYTDELASIRAAHETRQDEDATASEAYELAIARLHERHRDMLLRKFGPH